jgi:orotate phosphoribosyltransferase
MTSQQIIASRLLQIEAVKLSPEAPYTWASGWKSPIYCDNRKVLSYPTDRDFIKSEMCSVIFNEFPDAELIAGVATAGIAWGAMVADQLKLPFAYVRPKPKDHGLGNQIEGRLEAGNKVVVIEDLVSTGSSSLKACDAIKAQGAEIIGMVCIFNYGFQMAATAFEQAQLKVISLTDYPTLTSLAVQKSQIRPEHLNLLQEWRLNPDQWGQ